MSASLAEKHLDAFHVRIQLFIDAISQCLALLVHLLLQLSHLGIGAKLHGLDLLKLLLKLGDSGFDVG